MPTLAAEPTTRSERIEARVSPETKALCQQAAAIQGSTLTEFMVNSAVEKAERTIRENELAALTRRDKMAFVEALLQAPAPNERLKKAAARHTQMFQE